MLVKEANYLLIDFSDPKLNLESLRGSLGLVKQRSLRNKFRGMREIAGIVAKNAAENGYSALTAVPYAIATFLKAQIAGASRVAKSLTERDIEMLGSYLTGLSPESISLPETRVFEQHPDIDSLEDAYKIAREMYRRRNGGDDISNYRVLEDKITYETENCFVPLINTLNYDRLHAVDFTRKKEDWRLSGGKYLSMLREDILGKNPDSNMEHLFYAKLNHSLKEQRL